MNRGRLFSEGGCVSGPARSGRVRADSGDAGPSGPSDGTEDGSAEAGVAGGDGGDGGLPIARGCGGMDSTANPLDGGSVDATGSMSDAAGTDPLGPHRVGLRLQRRRERDREHRLRVECADLPPPPRSFTDLRGSFPLPLRGGAGRYGGPFDHGPVDNFGVGMNRGVRRPTWGRSAPQAGHRPRDVAGTACRSRAGRRCTRPCTHWFMYLPSASTPRRATGAEPAHGASTAIRSSVATTA